MDEKALNLLQSISDNVAAINNSINSDLSLTRIGLAIALIGIVTALFVATWSLRRGEDTKQQDKIFMIWAIAMIWVILIWVIYLLTPRNDWPIASIILILTIMTFFIWINRNKIGFGRFFIKKEEVAKDLLAKLIEKNPELITQDQEDLNKAAEKIGNAYKKLLGTLKNKGCGDT